MAHEVDVGYIKSRLPFLYDMINELDTDQEPHLVRSQVAAICAMISRLGGLGAWTWPVDDAADYRVVCALDGDAVKARHGATGKTVLLRKIFSVRYALREACFLAACRGHPSLVGLHAVAAVRPKTTNGPYLLATEHVGLDLHTIVVFERRKKPFPEAEVRRIMRHLLRGAAAMHERGIVHGFLHPCSVFLAGDGAFKIGDFWRARPARARTAHAGAPEDEEYAAKHAAPDEGGGAGDERTDAWYLGSLMAFLVAGGDERYYGEALPSGMRALGIPRSMLSDDGVEVLNGLLEENPSERLTPAAALRLPWFKCKEPLATAAAHRLKRLRFPRLAAVSMPSDQAKLLACMLLCVLASFYFYFFNSY